MQIKIFHIEGRRSSRIVWVCEELGIPYELVFKADDLVGSMQIIREANSSLPLAPSVRINDQVVVESGAIVDILLARSASDALRPEVGSADFVLHTQWMHFAEGTAMARMLMWRFVATALGRSVEDVPQGYRAGVSRWSPTGAALMARAFKLATKLGAADWLTRSMSGSVLPGLRFLVGPQGIFDAMEQHLTRWPFFGGSQFTAADIMMHFPVRHAALICEFDLKEFPRLNEWRREIEARPAYIRAENLCQPRGVDDLGLPQGSPNPFATRADLNLNR
jgi:glutathione S-transferase